ncbi:MAG: hypothetical protein JRI68_23400 [Deltaproteobacteria bacterium]|nr:hypothetical protein [Deltaproteobacteria bacterium]
MRWWLIALLGMAPACASFDPGPVEPPVEPATDHATPPQDARLAPACPEVRGGAWPRAAPGPSGLVRVVRGFGGRVGHLAQTLHDGRHLRLRFLGAHLFDLLDKLWQEGGPSEIRRRQLVCAVLNDAAARGVQVLRIWGTLKRTGKPAELDQAAQMLALVLDENARRRHPLRFIVPLLNHQAGYGAPDPSRSLDDQPSANPWHARSVYLGGAWRQPGIGQVLDRIIKYRTLRTVAASRYLLAWELVNELDTFRHIGGGKLGSAAAEQLRDGFLVPALTELARRFPQPIVLGDLRGSLDDYEAYARSTLAALPALALRRVIWSSHVYGEKGAPPRAFMHKLAVDLEIAGRHGLPFLLGEVGEHVPGATVRFCGEAPRHDLGGLLRAVRATGVEAAVVWGEGRCALPVEPATGWRMSLGAGADSAEIGADDHPTHRLLRETRLRWAPSP